MHIIHIGKRKFKLPSSWKEVSWKVVCKISPLMLSDAQKETVQYFFISQYIKAKHLKRIPSDFLPDIFRLVSFLHEGYTFQVPKSIATSFRRKPLVLQNRKGTFTILEVALCDIYFQSLKTEKPLKDVIESVFYTVCRPFGEKYTDEIKEFSIENYKVSDGAKCAVFLFVSNWLNDFQKTYSPKDSDSDQTEKSNPYGLFPLIYQLSESGVYGSYEQVCEIPAHTVFFNMEVVKSLRG